MLKSPAALSAGASSHPALLVFHLSDKTFALPLACIERLVPIAALAHPPGMPIALEGILNVGGEAVPTFRLDRLFGLPEQRVGLYSTLILVRDAAGRFALLVEQASYILQAGEGTLVPIAEGATWNGCVAAVVRAKDAAVHALSPAKVLLEKERQALRDFQLVSQQRMEQWWGGAA